VSLRCEVQRKSGPGCWLAVLLSMLPGTTADAADPPPTPEEIITRRQSGTLGEKEGTVMFKPSAFAEVPANIPQPLAFGDTVRTHLLSRAAVQLDDRSQIRLKELTRLQIERPRERKTTPNLRLESGEIYISSRGGLQPIRVETPHVSGVPKGTEFLVRVDAQADRTEVTMLDGEVELIGAVDTRWVRTGEQGIAAPGQPIEVRPVLQAQNVVQWWIYYPGVLDPGELGLTPAQQTELNASLTAYRSGDLQEALKRYPAYPTPAEPDTDAKRVYYAGLLLAVGAVDRAESQLSNVNSNAPLARALRTMIFAVGAHMKALPPSNQKTAIRNPKLDISASELVALSYAYQSTNNLGAALDAARAAVKRSPQFAFAWVRVAELEFSFGHTAHARETVNKALELAPRNAQAQALEGFLLAAEYKIHEAILAFDRAIAIDPALGNAWLGRGLCKRRLGWFGSNESRREFITTWLSDLQTAAILEPTRSLVRSYVGKAFSEIGDARLAQKELDYARKVDAQDPTAWLYSALEDYQQNRVNEAVRDLGRSIELNDNRAVYRSRLLLDQDLAVRSASLASIYHDAGMNEVSLREAARAVGNDYANYSAHLFLANSYDALRDPTRFNLRYETPWFNELLLANLQAPPGVPTISANISQQEYSRLFERDRLGVTTTTELRGDGQYREKASQFGAWGAFSYSLDLDWQRNEGVRPNNELNRTEWYSQLKYRLTPQDSILALIKYQDYDSGDNFQYYDASSARPQFHYSQQQTPLLLAGWHHEWSPGIHTLFLGGRLVNQQQLSDTVVTQTVAVVNPVGVLDPSGVPFDVNYQSDFEIYSAELNQIFQRKSHTDILGARFQDGSFRADNTFANPPTNLASVFTLPSVSETDNDFHRVSLYAYHHWEIIDSLVLIGGVVYDVLRYPANFRRPPLNTDESHQSQVSPKAAMLWDITPNLRVRAAYAQGIGGVSYDESVRLEPTQLAGFSQSFRSLISESLVGSVEAPRHEIIGSAIDLRPWTNAWLSLQGDILQERVDREIGIFNYNFSDSPPATPASTSEQLDYHEFNARVIFNQIIGSEWSLEAQYQFTRSELDRTLPDIAATAGYARTSLADADLHQFGLAATWQHPSGFFARGDFREMLQRLGDSSAQPRGDDFPLLNLFLGYRFPRRRGELTLGIMNLCDQDYHFSPLNYHPEFPHERVFYTRFTLNF
jgi:tetratricopeptide (TPR) repeat protein